MSRRPGKFWPDVRACIWEKAEELHAKEFNDGHEENITPPTRRELREGGYFYRAKCLVHREINRRNLGPGGLQREDDEAFVDYLRTFGGLE